MSNILIMDGRRLPQIALEDALAQYLDHAAHRGLAPNSVKAYKVDLRQALQHFVDADVVYVALVSERAIEHWLASLSRLNVQPRSQARKLAVLRGFLRYAKRESWIHHDPTNDVAVKFQARRVRAPEMEQFHSLIDAIPSGECASTLDLRDRALLRLTLDSALRISEVTGLDIGSTADNTVDLRRGEVHVTGKGGKPGCVAINARTVTMLQDWLRVRDRMARSDETALFVSERGGRPTRQTLHAMLRRRGQAIGITNLHMHLLRHRRIGDLMERLGVQVGQGHARHASAVTTMSVYGAHADAVVRRTIRERADLDEGRAQA